MSEFCTKKFVISYFFLTKSRTSYLFFDFFAPNCKFRTWGIPSFPGNPTSIAGFVQACSVDNDDPYQNTYCMSARKDHGELKISYDKCIAKYPVACEFRKKFDN